ncbi:MAG: histidine phosphatase family protein [Elusimicrobiaceae bacterium]|nr:histidine phosphatase family protein [Elusimicrobiaceae bacterium]
MTKTLILMRHGQAEPYAPADHLRPLTPYGKQVVCAHAGQLFKQNLLPDLILASPLLRAQETAQIVSGVLQTPYQTLDLLDGRLSADGLLKTARQTLMQTNTLMLIGHNPNMAIAAQLLCGQYFPFDPGTIAAFDMSITEKSQLIFRSIHEHI